MVRDGHSKEWCLINLISLNIVSQESLFFDLLSQFHLTTLYLVICSISFGEVYLTSIITILHKEEKLFFSIFQFKLSPFTQFYDTPP